ncbi:MAG: RHS repeat protein [Fibrobacteria bacterium]|nr:RHS repeat protein [Fibrobacteria bacterium]
MGANSGNLTDYRIDLTIPAKLPFGITPYYNSDNPYFGHLGYGWSSILSVRLFHWPDSTWSLRDPWGRRENFNVSGNHDSTGGRFYGDTLRIAGDSVVLRVDEKTTWVFDRADGTLREVHNDAGHGYRLTYDASADPRSQAVAGTSRRKYPIKGISKYAIPRGLRSTIAMDFRVVALEDKANPAHRIQISYDTSGMVSTATDHVGRSVGYSYDQAGNLSQVRHVDSTVQRWRFEDSTDTHRISAFDPLPLGAEDTLDPARMLKNKWDRLGRVVYQGMSRGDTKQEHSFERNPYSTSCTENSGATGSWTKRCTHVRVTTVNRTDADGLGGSRQSSRSYLDSVVNDIPMSQQNQAGPAKFVERHITLTESVNGDAIRLKLIFDDKNNVKKVLRPDGTEMFLYGPSGEGGIIGPLVTAVSQQPPTGRGPKRTDGNAFSFSYSGSITNGLTEADSWSFQNGSPFTYRTEKLRSFKGEVNGTTYQYGFDTATTRKSFDAKGRLDSLYGFHGFEAKAWYVADTSALPDSFTYADGTGLRIWRDGLGQITATRDALGRTSHFRYTAKGDVKMACGPDSLCVWNTWKNRAIVGTLVGMRLRPDGSMTPPLESYAYRVNDQKRRTHTFRLVGSDSILIEKRLLDVWGNLAVRWVNPDTANTDSSAWQEVERNTYDARNRRTQHASKVNGQWQTVAYQYDVLGNLTKLTDARGVWTHVKMDAYGNVMSRRDTLGRTWSATYNERGLPLTETDPLGRVVSHEWNHLGNETHRIGWRQDTTLWIWKHDRLLKHRTPEGRWTVFGYDTLSRLVRAVSKVGDSALVPDADDLVTTWTYDKVGNRVTETVAGRKTHGWNVDGSGNVLADTNALGQVTRYVYDDLGQVTAVVGPTVDTLSVAYDGRGAVSMSRIGRDTLMQARSNNLGLPSWIRRPGEGAVSSQFDAQGYLASVQDSMERSFGFRKDAFGVDSIVSSVAGPRTATRDVSGRLVRLEDENGNATVFAWDNVDRLKSVTNPSGGTTTYLYADSANGWQTRTTTRTGGGVEKSERHAWDRDGLLRLYTDGRGVTAIYSYDSLARMTGIAFTKADGTPAGAAKAFRYTPEGLTRAMEYGAVRDSFAYDALGRVTKSWQIIGSKTYTTEHRYGDASRLDSLIHPDGSIVVRRLDARGRSVSLWRNGVRLDTLVWEGSRRASRVLGNGITTSYGYDANGRLTSLQHTKGADLVTGYGFGYAASGKLAWQERQHAPGQSEVYDWTTDGQLLSVSRGTMNASHTIASPVWSQNWGTEASGNWPTVTTAGVPDARAYDPLGATNFAGGWTVEHDDAGNMISDGVDTYTWTPDGRLEGAAGKVQFVYDALGRLVQRIYPDGKTVDVVYDGWREVYSASSTGETTARVWGNYLDEEVAEVHKAGASETVLYPLVGNNWNVEALTDGTGSLVRGYVVDPFGTFTVTTGAGVDGVWFTADDVAGNASALEGERVLQGLPWYGSVGFYQLRNRWYSPKLGQFLSIDPLGFESGDANLYQFEGNDPLGNLDPMGTLTWSQAAWTIGISAGVGLAAGALLPLAPVWVTTAAALGGSAGLGYAIGDAANTIQQLVTGREIGTGRELCPSEIGALKDHLLLGAIGFAAGGAGAALGAKLSGPLGNALASLTGRAGSAGAEVAAGEAGAGLTPRGGPAPDPTPGPAPTMASSGAESVNAQTALTAKLSALEDAQSTAATTRNLPDGRIRYYDAEAPARTVGPTRGASYVTEYNPNNGNVRSWMESYDQTGNINRVHPKMLNGQTLNSWHFPPTAKELGL